MRDRLGGKKKEKRTFNTRRRIGRRSVIIVTEDSAVRFVEEYRRKWKAGIIAESTYRNVLFVMTTFFDDYLSGMYGDHEKYEITPEILDDFFMYLLERKYSKKTLEKFVTYVGAYIKKLASYQGVPFNYEFSYRAIYGGKGIKKDDYTPEYLRMTTPPDIQHVLDELYYMYHSGQISDLVYDRLRLILLLGAYTGMRGTEMGRIRVKHIDFNRNLISVYRDKIVDESEKITYVPMHPILAHYLQYYIEKYRLKRNDRILPLQSVDKYLYRYGISKKVSLRAMRSMVASLIARSRFLEYLMGHSARGNWIKRVTVEHYLSKPRTSSGHGIRTNKCITRWIEKTKQKCRNILESDEYVEFWELLWADYMYWMSNVILDPHEPRIIQKLCSEQDASGQEDAF